MRPGRHSSKRARPGKHSPCRSSRHLGARQSTSQAHRNGVCNQRQRERSIRMQRREMLRILWQAALASALPFTSHIQAQSTEDVPDKVEVLCSYPGGGLAHALSWSTLAKASVPQMVSDITHLSGLRPNFHVGTGE